MQSHNPKKINLTWEENSMSKGLYGRKDRLIKDKRHDAYQEREKLPEPTLCTQCNALYVNGRWTWNTEPDRTYRTVCPACRRIAANYPAGYITLRGSFLAEHQHEIMNLILNEEKREKSDRPLERIISVVGVGSQIEVTTTGIHVARRIGDSLSRAYDGELSFRYADSDRSIRVYWQRDLPNEL
jgi:NMD protein affecting ribosome stability and mRNA decay